MAGNSKIDESFELGSVVGIQPGKTKK